MKSISLGVIVTVLFGISGIAVLAEPEPKHADYPTFIRPPFRCGIVCVPGTEPVPPCGCRPIATSSSTPVAKPSPPPTKCGIVCVPGTTPVPPCGWAPIASPSPTPSTLVAKPSPPPAKCDIACEPGTIPVPPCGCAPIDCPPGARKRGLCPLACPPEWTQNHGTCQCIPPIAKRTPICAIFCPDGFRLGPGCRCNPISPVC